MSATRFDDTHVLVTGGSSGIGLATARLMARRGAHVCLLARDEDKLEAAREAVAALARDPKRQKVWTRSVDITDPEATRAVVGELIDEGFAPDIVVNCAGIIEVVEFEHMAPDVFRQLIETDLFGLVNVTRAVLPTMTSRGSGAIVNVSSGAGFVGVYGYSGYSAAKFAIMGFSESLRQELKPEGVSVHVVCPADTDTPQLAYERSHRPLETDKIAGNVKPIGPDVVARAIVRGIERGRYLIIPDFATTFYFYLNGIAPWLVRFVFDGQVASARKEREIAEGQARA